MSHQRKILQGSASNMARVGLSMLVSLVLPPLLVHRMQPAEYSAWVLILQTSSYIGLLDLGLQTAVGKFVAEYHALGDRLASSRTLSNSFAILCISSLFGAAVISIVAWRVPQLFHQMPPSLIGDVRIGVLVIGMSAVFALPFGAFLAAFTGLQQYGFPTILAISTRVLSAIALVALLLMHGHLVQLIWMMATFNIATAIAQFVGWRRYASKSVGFSLRLVTRETSLRLVRYGSVLSLWTVATLFISGLDMVIVGHFDFKNTGYYGIASAVTNFMLLVIGSLFGPILPAVSSLQVGRTAGQIGDMVVRATRYCSILLCLIGLPLILGAYPLLKLWVGNDYALRSAFFLQILILGNVVRQLGYPYSLVVIAVGKQHLATLAGIVEACVNVAVSIYLVQRIGALGVAIGTLVGAFVSVGMHLAVSMKLTHSTIQMSRVRLLLIGVLRPMLITIPTLLLLPLWRRFSMLPAAPIWMLLWVCSTAAIAWFAGITPDDRANVRTALNRLLYSRKA